MHRDANRTGLVGHSAGDGLTNPPRRVCRELVALGVVELLDCTDQAQVALLDEVQERHTAAGVTLGEGDNQSEVRLEEVVLRAVAVAADPVHVAALGHRELFALRGEFLQAERRVEAGSMRFASSTSSSALRSATLPICLR